MLFEGQETRCLISYDAAFFLMLASFLLATLGAQLWPGLAKRRRLLLSVGFLMLGINIPEVVRGWQDGYQAGSRSARLNSGAQ